MTLEAGLPKKLLVALRRDEAGAQHDVNESSLRAEHTHHLQQRYREVRRITYRQIRNKVKELFLR
jgi:hypothetical protein